MNPIIIPDRLNLLATITLDDGAHDTFDAGHCGMEVAAWLAGEEHTDRPECVCPVIGAFVRSLNDSLPDDQRTALLRDLIPLTVGTRGSDDLQDRRALAAADWAVRVYSPAWLRLAGLNAEADTLASLAPIASVEAAIAATAGPIKQAREAAAAARAAAGAAAWDAARAAARAAAWAAARDAARAAAGAAAWAAAWAAAGDALRPTTETLQESAHQLVDRMLAVTEAAS